MKKHVRKWMIGGLVLLAVVPAMAGCVATVGPDYYHRPCCWYGWHEHDHWRDRDWR